MDKKEKKSFVHNLKVKARNLTTITKTPTAFKRNSKTKHGSHHSNQPGVNITQDTPSSSSYAPASIRPRRPPPPPPNSAARLPSEPFQILPSFQMLSPFPNPSNVPLANVPRPLASPRSSTPNTPLDYSFSVPKSLADPWASLASFTDYLKQLPLPSSAWATVANVESVLGVPMEYVASLLPPSVKNIANAAIQNMTSGNISYRGMQQNLGASSSTHIGSTQDSSTSNLNDPVPGFPFNFSDLPFVGSYWPASDTSVNHGGQHESSGGRPKHSHRKVRKDNNVTADAVINMLNNFFSKCDPSAKKEVQETLSELQRKVSGSPSSSDEEICKICMENPIDCVILDCGHVVACLKCGRRLLLCPICRQQVARVLRTYKS